MLDKDLLRELLVEKYDYKNSKVDGVIEKINKFSEKVSASFEKWITTGIIDDIEVEGYTVNSIITKKKMKIVAAYLMMDWLERDAKAAKLALNSTEFAKSAVKKY
jgi:hypothetical protein